MSYFEAKEIDQEIKRKRPPNTGSNAQRPTHREELWRLNLAHLAAGALGDQGNPETMLRYWKTQETAGYPGASENVQYFTKLVEKERPIPTARWKGAGMGDYYCSFCQYKMSGCTKFCPECGAKMDEWEAQQ